MKKISFILVIAFIFMTNLFAQDQILTVGKSNAMMNELVLVSQNDNQITIRFDLNELGLLEVETGYGKAFIVMSNKAPLMLQEGAPELFYLTATFVIPNRGNSDLEISYGKYIDFENIEIAPSKGNLPRSIDPKTVPFVKGNVYQENKFYPEALATLREPFIMRDVRGQSLDVHPVQYNPVTKVLRVYTEITVTVNNNTRIAGVNEFTNQKRHQTVDPTFHSMYSNLFMNYADLSRGYPTGEEGELLIICHPAFMDAMKPYIDWKRTIGRKTTMVSTAVTGTTRDAIKTYISNYYNNPANNLAYVLFVGGAAQIPPHLSNVHREIRSDVFYGQLAGNDPYLEVLIGRISATTVAHVQTQVQRTIHYERDITTADTWLSNGMGIAQLGDYAHMNDIRNRLLNYGYSTVYEEYENVPGVPNTSATQISQRLNNGVGVINYCDHGNTTSWKVASYNNSHVNALTNAGKLPYIFSAACSNGSFSTSPSFAETWMRATHNNQPTGAITTFMATIDIHATPSIVAQNEFVNICLDLPSIYGPWGQPPVQPGIKRTFAGAALNATQKMVMVRGLHDWKTIDDYNSWTVFGDPTLMIRTKTPQNMTVSHPPAVVSSPFVVTCNTEGAVATLSYINDDNEVIILGTATVSGGVANIAFTDSVTSSMDVILAVTGFNKVTYINPVFQTVITTTTTTWNSNSSICQDIIITNNSTLNINNCTISLCAYAKIIIQPGGKLVINGATLTNSTPGQMWQGIIMSGNNSSVEIKNNGKIENAICGITVNGGTVASSIGAQFINNKAGVKFNTSASSGTFSQTSFTLDNSYFGNTAFEAHLKTEGSGQVSVAGCTFLSHLTLNPNNGIVISNTSTNWSANNQLLSVPVALQSAAVLDIIGTVSTTDNIYSSANTTITVHPGGKFIINGGTLRNATAGTMWQGITVMGNSSLPISQTNQGYLQIINNGKIENAICGITVNGGGIVEANNAKFINNRAGVKFEQIVSNQSGTSGTFTNTEFTLDNGYYGNFPSFEAHLKMEGCGQVLVTGCTFSSPALLNPDKGIVISNTSTNWLGTNKLISVLLAIQTGAILTNTGTISSDQNTVINVHSKGKLIINGGIFNSNLANTMWQGITVMGDTTHPLTQTHQGYIQIINNGKIENAVCGINVNGGGMVATNNAKFINNRASVKFEPVGSTQSGTSGTFTNTEFAIINGYIGHSSSIEGYLKMESCGQVLVTGCTFSSPVLLNPDRGIVISNTSTNWLANNQLLSVPVTLQLAAALNITGNLLTTGNIYSSANAAITVHPGSKFFIDGGIITNATTGTMWQGITVMGNPLLPISPNNQGYLYITNNGRIENAITGITVSSGGMVEANNAKFINNKTGVKLEPTSSNQSGEHSGNFTNTAFILNSNYFGNTSGFEAHLKMEDCSSVNVTGSTFSSSASLNQNQGIIISNVATSWSGSNDLQSVPVTMQAGATLSNTGNMLLQSAPVSMQAGATLTNTDNMLLQSAPITIQSGATLTNTGTVSSNRHTGITVHPKGKLIIDGGIFNSNSAGTMWQGITVMGDSTKPLLPLHQGYVQIINNGTII